MVNKFNTWSLFLFAFSEIRFSTPHYQSIRPEDGRNIINEYIDNNRDSLNSSRSTTLASFHQSSSESLFYPPMSSSLVGSSVNKFLVEGGRQSTPRLCEHPPQRIVPRKGVHTNYFRKAFLFCRVAWLCTGADSGNCMVCQETVPGKPRDLDYHLFNDCKEFLFSK